MGRALSAEAVVEGTVERSSDQIRMTLRVIDVATGAVLWSDTLTRGARTSLFFRQTLFAPWRRESGRRSDPTRSNV